MTDRFDTFPLINGVRRLNGSAHPFEALYLYVREKENRVLNDQQVAQLPAIEKDHEHAKEWAKRSETAHRFLEYLKSKETGLRILDIGCGNAWFSNKMANQGHEVMAQDLNLYELEQGRRVFQNDQLHFIYAHELDAILENDRFDMITFNASFQYFGHGKQLLETLKSHLTERGELHILDTPFYQGEREKQQAKSRTEMYYQNMNCPELAQFYHHYALDDLVEHEILYKPKFSRLSRLFGKTVSPFCWIKIVND